MRREVVMPRLFTGLEIPEDVAFDLSFMQGGIPGARWIEPENFHLTIRFIGDIDDRLARELTLALESVKVKPFTLSLKGVGVFGGNQPHSLYVGVEDNGEIKRLQAQHDRQCQVLGLPPEGRKFVPHVTLARLKNPDPRALQRYVELHNLYRSTPFDVAEFVLFNSRPLRGGGPYGIQESYQLGMRE
jgi:RNA 2',3'-cyclic 3'-phosphodiesterase